MIKQHVRHIFKTLGVAILLALTITSCLPQSYRVQAGDTLALIATEHGTSVEKLVELNRDQYPSLTENPSLIETGWELQLPGGSFIEKSTPSSAPVATPATAVFSREEAELEIVRLVNEERAKAGLPALEIDPGLMELARSRSEDMVARGYFSHYDPETGERLWGKNASENIAAQFGQPVLTQQTPGWTIASWLHSEGHKTNLLRSNWQFTGMGVAVGSQGTIITQVFK